MSRGVRLQSWAKWDLLGRWPLGRQLRSSRRDWLRVRRVLVRDDPPPDRARGKRFIRRPIHP